MIRDFFLIPKPKMIKIGENSGIRLNESLTIYLNKYKIRDSALLISSRFNKHFSLFMKTVPIKDRQISEKHLENYYLSIITSELNFKNVIAHDLNAKFEEKLKLLNNHSYQGEKFALEGYFINIKANSIWIISKSRAGFYYGIETVIQIIDNVTFQHKKFEDFIEIPELTIIDFPLNKTRFFPLKLSTGKKIREKYEIIKFLIPFLGKFKLNGTNFEQPSNITIKELEELSVFHHLKVFEPSRKATNEESVNLIVEFLNEVQIIPMLFYSELFWNFKDDPEIQKLFLKNFDWNYFSRALELIIFEVNISNSEFNIELLTKKDTMDNLKKLEFEFSGLYEKAYENKNIIAQIIEDLKEKIDVMV